MLVCWIRPQPWFSGNTGAGSLLGGQSTGGFPPSANFGNKAEGLTPNKISSVGVVGGGLMGTGIATSLVLTGHTVVIKEVNQAAADKARDTVRFVAVACGVVVGRNSVECRSWVFSDKTFLAGATAGQCQHERAGEERADGGVGLRGGDGSADRVGRLRGDGWRRHGHRGGH